MFQKLFAIWAKLSLPRQAVALSGLVVVTLSVILLFRLATTPNFALLYGNLPPARAGEVISALDLQGVRYLVRGNSIYVEETLRDEVRLRLATEGLPERSSSGYELLDNITGFGTTSQMFDAAYSRAIEGELARTIASSTFIRNARVHIARTSSAAFRGAQTVSASVFVQPESYELSTENARALKFLVASAISELSPEDVAVIDSITGMVIDDSRPIDSSLVVGERAMELQESVKRLLEAHVGRGNARVKVYLEADTSTESIVERRFDPESRVAVSTDTQEISRSSTGPAGGSVTVASNVPGGDAAETGSESSSQDSEIRERTNFEISEVQREVVTAPGTITRLTVAVLVNGIQSTAEEEGNIGWRPRSEAELADLRELVESSVGYREDRGDVVTIKSLQFEIDRITENIEDESSFILSHLDFLTLIQLGVVSFVALLLGFFVIRPIFLQPTSAPISSSLEEDDSNNRLPQPEDISEEVGSIPGLNQLNAPSLSSLDDISSSVAMTENFDFDETGNNPSEDAVDKLKQVIESRQPDTIEILRNWLENSDEQHEVA